jgi:putative SOS response-associated peptidase YedK
MCGRYTQTSDAETLFSEFDLTPSETVVEPRYNLAPAQMGPVALDIGEGKPALKLMRWGLVPAWAKEERVGFKMINARAETIDTKPAFKRLFKSRRCLVLADGFYEWKSAGKGETKIPYRFTLKGGRPFALAGLWDRWGKGEDGILETYTIVTTSANDLVGQIHPRMPVILDPEGRTGWLDPDSGEDSLRQLLAPFEAGEMVGHRVSTLVNKPVNDDKGLILPVEDGPGPGLFD